MVMKKCLLLFVVAAIALTQPVQLFADAVWGNDFASKKEKEIEWLERNRFVVNAPEGFVIIKESPGFNGDMIQYIRKMFSDYGGISVAEVKSFLSFKNGQEFFVTGILKHRGEYWGVMSAGHSVIYPGWVPMKDLLVIYTAADFKEEHADEIYADTGDRASSLNDKLVIWEWPGADRGKRALYTQELQVSESGGITIEYIYKDPEGREWGYADIRYDLDYYLHSNMPGNGWICLDDPANEDIPAFNPAPEPRKWEPKFQGFTTTDNVATIFPSATPVFTGVSGKAGVGTVIIIMGVVVAILATGIFVLYRQAKNK